jgi:hypothetical protein
MSIRLALIAVMVLSISPSNAATVTEVATVQVQAVKPDLKTIAILNAKEIRQQAKRDKLKRVVSYLTTRVHRTSLCLFR